MIIVNKGKIVADDSTEKIQKGTSTKQIITVEFDKEPSKNLLKNIAGVNTVRLIKNNTWQIESSSEKDIRAEVFQWAVQNNLTVLAMQKEEQKLEDVFKELTK